MIVLAWNCRGLGNTRAVRVLGELIKAHRPDVVFLSETLVSNQKMEEVRVKIKFEGCFAVAARDYGCSGRGISIYRLLWFSGAGKEKRGMGNAETAWEWSTWAVVYHGGL
ncbi:hypothetical protein LINGRAHAP2_LOCUS11596 [Linum grandiflorum]